MDIIEESGILGIATRLQRLSDEIRKEGMLIYKALGIDFEPKWFPVIYVLSKKPGLSVIELAAEIGYAHPSTITLLKELDKAKLVVSKKHKSDERKRLLHLSKKGNELVAQMQPAWKTIIAASTELTNTENNLMKAIVEVELNIKEKGFFERAKKYMPSKDSEVTQ